MPLVPTVVFNPDSYEWERSGLFEGDIVLHDHEKNVLVSNASKWPNATIPFHIQEDDFTDEEIKVILLAVREFHTKTCLRLKPYEPTDENWISITGNDRGCFSYVGNMNEGGQQLNLFTPNCVKKGIVQHELLHSAGFYHQQSSTNRDEYIEIIWENIDEDHAGNFRKYDSNIITDYDLEYDFDSIMHYSSKAFSKNGNATIVPKQNVSRLGQRNGFTEIDIAKLNRMYNESCHELDYSSDDNESHFDIINWFQLLF